MELCLAIQITVALKNESSSFSDDRDLEHNEVIHYVWSGDQVGTMGIKESCREPRYGVVARNNIITQSILLTR